MKFHLFFLSLIVVFSLILTLTDGGGEGEGHAAAGGGNAAHNPLAPKDEGDDDVGDGDDDDSKEDSEDDFDKAINKPVYSDDPTQKLTYGKYDDFKWKTCDPHQQFIEFKKVKLMPAPIILPGSIKMEADFTLKRAISDKFKMEVLVKKKGLGGKFYNQWCHGMGSKPKGMKCTWNLCEFITSSDCPKELESKNGGCNCPVKQGSYSIKDWTLLHLSKSNTFLKAIGHGEIRARIEIKNGKTKMGCVDIQIKVGDT